ncbi:MAG: ABC transporter ATP-binding protein, partial [Candidatus Methylomirabilales bacterium]
MKILEVKRLSFSYGQGFALKGVSFDVAEGEILGVIGPNGSGKTTLLRLLSKVLTPYEGSIRFLGKELRTFSRREVAKLMAVVPQEPHLAFPFTVLQMVLMGRYPHSRGYFFEGEEDLRVAEEAMNATGVLHLANKSLDELSGGERRLATIARALAHKL